MDLKLLQYPINNSKYNRSIEYENKLKQIELEKCKKNGQPPMPKNNNDWIDSLGNKYTFKNDTLTIVENEIKPDFVSYINSLPKNINIVIKINNFESVKLFKGVHIYGNVTLDLTDTKAKDNDSLSVDDILTTVDNIKFKSCNSIYSGKLNNIESWILNLPHQEAKKVLSKFDSVSQNRFKKLIQIAEYYYENIVSKLEGYGELEKVQMIFDEISKTIKYAFDATNRDGTLDINAVINENHIDDPIWTFENKKGVCSGRSRLLQLALNNSLSKIKCYTAQGMYVRLEHEWNVVYYNGIKLYYDLSFNSKAMQRLPISYKLKEEYDPNSELNNSKQNTPALPKQNTPPELPKQVKPLNIPRIM